MYLLYSIMTSLSQHLAVIQIDTSAKGCMCLTCTSIVSKKYSGMYCVTVTYTTSIKGC